MFMFTYLIPLLPRPRPHYLVSFTVYCTNNSLSVWEFRYTCLFG